MKKILITGNVGKDPERRADQNGNSFATFSVAVSVGNKQTPKTDWVDVTCSGKLADVVCTYLKKGTKVLVSGFPSVNAYINRDNVAIATLRVYANEVEFLSAKNDGESTPSNDNDGVHNLPSNETSLQSDDIPF